MQGQVFRNISRIIERDSKVSTYKFALLRGTIDIIQENSPYIIIKEDRVHFPVGLLIEKWLFYYYPLLASELSIPQNYGKSNLAFELEFKELISLYSDQNGLSVFYKDLTQDCLPESVKPVLLRLVKKLRNTITNMPMKYIGFSVNQQHYSVYQKENIKRNKVRNSIDLAGIINNNGWFSIPLDYYEVFKLIGSFLGGQDSILFKWAEFSVHAAGGSLKMETALEKVSQSPVTQRDSEQSKKLYENILRNSGEVKCVWTGKSLNEYHIDHLIPFSVWRNNDLWNLLPASSRVNAKKSDKIPTPELIENSAPRIVSYWDRIDRFQPERFAREIGISLIGPERKTDWRNQALIQLKERCRFLIDNRGCEAWTG